MTGVRIALGFVGLKEPILILGIEIASELTIGPGTPGAPADPGSP